MNNKIAKKLIVYFTTTLLVFSMIVGLVFVLLFRNHAIETSKQDMKARAEQIAITLSGYMNKPSSSHMGGMMGYGSYLQFLDEIANADVWIVDEELNLITMSHMGSNTYHYSDLPANADAIVKEVFQGKTNYSEAFSSMLVAPSISVGTPIMRSNKVVGAVLLHSPIKGINDAILQGFQLLILSAIIALLISSGIAIVLALEFTKPLKKMNETALQLANKNYQAKTMIHQKDEIGELAETIDILGDRLEQASRESESIQTLRKEFIANISHELRTPVTVIRGSLEALCDGVVSEETQVHQYHQQMLSESIFLERLVNDLLELSRLENIDFKIELSEINLQDVLLDVARSARQLASKKRITIAVSLDKSIANMQGDYGRLRQMFLIILSNAIKFSKEDSVVEICLMDGIVVIRDHGVGIRGSDLPYLFHRFYQTKQTNKQEGTGLGLAIAQQIALRHGIDISVISKEQEGTQVSFQCKKEKET